MVQPTQPSRISREIPGQTVEEITGLLRRIDELLAPYTASLTAAQCHDLPKMGDKSLAFVQKAIGFTETNPELVPSYLDVAELKRDFALNQALEPVAQLLAQLSVSVQDTRLLSGSEAYRTALLYYNTVRTASRQGIAGAHRVYSDMSARFAGSRRKSSREQTDIS